MDAIAGKSEVEGTDSRGTGAIRDEGRHLHWLSGLALLGHLSYVEINFMLICKSFEIASFNDGSLTREISAALSCRLMPQNMQIAKFLNF